MQEILDRLREAVTALDNECMEEHYRDPEAMLTPTMRRLWQAKYLLWRAQTNILNAAAGPKPAPEPPF